MTIQVGGTAQGRRYKLMVAGCSFSAKSQYLPGTSWSEVLAKKLDWDLVNLARQGCSNGGIRIQIDEIRRQRPDFAIVSPTFWDRMEVPARAAPYDWSQKSGGWNPPLERHLQDRTRKNGYRREDGIDNVNYGNNNHNMICETIFTLAENYSHPIYRPVKIDRVTQTAVRAWIDGIYDPEWKKQQDEWIMREGILSLFLEGIPFLVLPNLLWPHDINNPTLWRDAFPSIIPDKYIQLDPNKTPQAVCGNYPFAGTENDDPGYHSSPEGQRVIAENFYKIITESFGISTPVLK
jgi:hypothetical protein